MGIEEREHTVEARAFHTHLKCAKCIHGTMQHDTKYTSVNAVLSEFRHKCSKCGAEEYLDKIYPSAYTKSNGTNKVLVLLEKYENSDVFLPPGNYPVHSEWEDGELFGYSVRIFRMARDTSLSEEIVEIDCDLAKYKMTRYWDSKEAVPALTAEGLVMGYATRLGDQCATLSFNRILPVEE